MGRAPASTPQDHHATRQGASRGPAIMSTLVFACPVAKAKIRHRVRCNGEDDRRAPNAPSATEMSALLNAQMTCNISLCNISLCDPVVASTPSTIEHNDSVIEASSRFLAGGVRCTSHAANLWKNGCKNGLFLPGLCCSVRHLPSVIAMGCTTGCVGAGLQCDGGAAHQSPSTIFLI